MPVVSLMAEMMEQYKDLWMSGHATPGYPAGHKLTPGDCVLYQRPDNSVVELSRGIYLAGDLSDLLQQLEDLIVSSRKLREENKRLADEQKKLLIELLTEFKEIK